MMQILHMTVNGKDVEVGIAPRGAMAQKPPSKWTRGNPWPPPGGSGWGSPA